MKTIVVGNVNDALQNLITTTEPTWKGWREIHPRGIPTMEFISPVATVYERPWERVLFSPVRDANPFFHFFEALWILDGRNDVKFLSQFNSNIANYSDDGETFHGAYGHRIRVSRMHDQLEHVIDVLTRDHDTRQAVIQLWDHSLDLGAQSKDIPCNDMIFFKIRANRLEMRVACRSNDMVWGGYGANAVQFSTLQEFVAYAVGVPVGPYTQISDSFHVYHTRDDWRKLTAPNNVPSAALDYYRSGDVEFYPMFRARAAWVEWLHDLREVLKRCEPDSDFNSRWINPAVSGRFPYFREVVIPMYRAWRIWKDELRERSERITAASYVLHHDCYATDWARAGTEWLMRRMHVNDTGAKV